VEINNLVEFDDLREPNEEGSNWDDFVDGMKGEVHKAAYIVRLKDGTYRFGCTEESKLGQERMLHRLRKLVEFYVDNYPDFEEIKETADLMGATEDEVIDAIYDVEGDEEED
jgi:hypothetical protein